MNNSRTVGGVFPHVIFGGQRRTDIGSQIVLYKSSTGVMGGELSYVEISMSSDLL